MHGKLLITLLTVWIYCLAENEIKCPPVGWIWWSYDEFLENQELEYDAHHRVSEAICQALCLYHLRCRSFNFKRNGYPSSCILNKATRETANKSYIKREGWIYHTLKTKPYWTSLRATKDCVLPNSYLLTCKAEAKPRAQMYKFYKDGKLEAEGSSGVYKIDNLVKGGNYKCVPSNELGEGDIASINIGTVCPEWPWHWRSTYWYNRKCKRDSDCPGIKLCCVDGSESFCTDPVRPRYVKKKVCPETPTNIECPPMEEREIECFTDKDCLANKICCPDYCAPVCLGKKYILHGENPTLKEANFTIKKTQKNTTTAIIRCSAVGEGLRTISWYKHNHFLLHKANVKTTRSPDGRKINSTLTVPNIECGQLTYFCAAKTDFGRHAERKINFNPCSP